MLLGRDAERAGVDELLDRARTGLSGCLLLTGDPGIGKSSLLRYAAERATDMTVLQARGYESEAHIAFAGLDDLLRPVLPGLDRLPAPQAAALRGALALGPPVEGDRFSVCAATVGVLAAAAENAPLLLIVDDVDWLDRSSREAILFAARRLHHEQIAMVLASRVPEGSETEYDGIRQLPVAPLAAADGERLLARLAPGSTAETRRRIYQAAAGNPLAMEELSTGDQAPPSSPGPSIAAGSRLTRALGRRLTGLPDRTVEAMLLVAASAGGDTDLVIRAARSAGLGLADFAPAEKAHLLVIEERRMVFRHPLLRSVLYTSASTHRRSIAHDRLATALLDVPGADAADARAWHLAAARQPPDGETARLLEQAGLRARHRGGHGEAARAYEQAARFDSPHQRADLLLRAARGWQLAGQTWRVLPLLEEALPLTDDPRLRGAILHMRAYLWTWHRRPAEGLHRLLEGAREIEAADPDRAVLMHADAAVACFILGRIEVGHTVVRRAYDLGRGAGEVAELVSTITFAAGRAVAGHRAEAEELLESCAARLDAADPLARAQELAYAGFVSLWLEDYEQAGRRLHRVIDEARRRGALGLLPQVLAAQAELCFRTGRWAQSRAAATESVALAAETRQASLHAQLLAARLDALQGREQESVQALDRIGTAAAAVGTQSLAPHLGHVAGLLALGRGDADEAVRVLADVRTLPMVQSLADQSVVPWGFDLVEAYVRSGHRVEAEELLGLISPDPDDSRRRWAQAAAARCRGLLATGADQLAELRHALVLHERAGQPFERARTTLALGECLRRDRQRTHAREYLRQALETFEQLDAVAWADRARSELAATGATLTRGPGITALLTPQELQVATVVARGASNSEAAAALFLSPKTIEYHLSNVYRKTRMKSRAELSVLALAAS